MKSLQKALRTIRLRRFRYLIYLITGFAWPAFAYAVFSKLPARAVRIARLAVVVALIAIVAYLSSLATSLSLFVLMPLLALMCALGWLAYPAWQLKRLSRWITQNRATGDLIEWREWITDPDTASKIDNALKKSTDAELPIGYIDNDGQVLGLYGALPGVNHIEEDAFNRRRRFSVSIIIRDGFVLIRKEYQAKRRHLLRETSALIHLQGKLNAPVVFDIDTAKGILYKSYVQGRNLRDILVDANADILSINTQKDPSLEHLDPVARIEAVWQRGRDVFQDCLPDTFLPKLEAMLSSIHAQGVVNFSLTYGNIMLTESDTPWFVDFDKASVYRNTKNVFFKLQRDTDRDKFNRIYGRDLLTHDSARSNLSLQDARHWYAPIDFGQGLATYGFWSTESGTGRWDLIKEHVIPLVHGRQILDLGSNNAIMPLMMLRNGAEKVVGLELSDTAVDKARLVHRIFEWQDMRPYHFSIYESDMRSILEKEWGSFDIITAYCTLYYLPKEDMARVVQKAASMAPVILVQANDGTRAHAGQNKAEKSSTEYLHTLLRENGFQDVVIVGPKNYERRLLIGYADSTRAV